MTRLIFKDINKRLKKRDEFSNKVVKHKYKSNGKLTVIYSAIYAFTLKESHTEEMLELSEKMAQKAKEFNLEQAEPSKQESKATSEI